MHWQRLVIAFAKMKGALPFRMNDFVVQYTVLIVGVWWGRRALFKQMLVFKLNLGQGEEMLVAAPLFSNIKLRGIPTLRAFESNQFTALCTMQQLFVVLFPENEYCIMAAFWMLNTYLHPIMFTVLNFHTHVPVNVLESMFWASD